MILCTRCNKSNPTTKFENTPSHVRGLLDAETLDQLKRTCGACGGELIIDEDQLAEIQAEKTRQEVAAFEKAKKTGDWSEVSGGLIDDAASKIILTTGYSIAGKEIECETEVVSAECAYGMNIFRDFFASVRDIVGGRSVATEKVLRDARRTALTELRREALRAGADAVIGVDLDYQELTGGGRLGMLLLVASGTAVKLKA